MADSDVLDCLAEVINPRYDRTAGKPLQISVTFFSILRQLEWLRHENQTHLAMIAAGSSLYNMVLLGYEEKC